VCRKGWRRGTLLDSHTGGACLDSHTGPWPTSQFILGFTQSLQANNSRVVSQLRNYSFLSNPFQFIYINIRSRKSKLKKKEKQFPQQTGSVV
jgi:hypothetical protein